MNKFIYLFLCFIILSCNRREKTINTQEATSTEEGNPAAENFNFSESDTLAINIADAVMKAMGGRSAWDKTTVIKWNFFGRRTWTWNKNTGDVRLDFNDHDSTIIITNIHTNKGKVKLEGVEITNSDSLNKHLKFVKSVWINDSYWLVMPFKLKDSNVTLKYKDTDTTAIGDIAHVLQLTFSEIGDTPENKYLIYVDTSSMLVKQWDYFGNANDTLPQITTPWNDYKKYGDILLSGDRGKGKITNIEVLKTVPENTFTTF